MITTMSSIYKSMGPRGLFDGDRTTMAHTNDSMPEKGWINIHLKTPRLVTEVLVMARDSRAAEFYLKRLNNTVITTTDDKNVTKECGKVILKEFKASIIIRVACKEVRRVVNVRVIASSPKSSINIAELRVCTSSSK